MNNLAASINWEVVTPKLWQSVLETLYMVPLTIGIGGVFGLLIGLTLYATRRGNLFENTVIYHILDFIINFIRPIPFIIFLTAIRPFTIFAVGTSIGTNAAVLPMVIICSVATGRIVEQNLVATDSGIVEAAQAMGAGRVYTLLRVVIPEALAPLILGYAFLFIGVTDMSAMAGVVAGGGLGNFALQYGFREQNDLLTWIAIAIIIIFVQLVQQLANFFAKHILNRH
jgi:D-methionine transport system permease protein